MIKRFVAYLIDITIVLLICTILYCLIPNININEYNHSLNEFSEQVLNNKISIYGYITNSFRINYLISKTTSVYIALNIMLNIIYFIIIPIYTKGKTIGLALFKLKISGKITFKSMFIRNIFTTGIIYMILNVLLVNVLDYKLYTIIIAILSFIQLLLVILSTSMIIYRRDKKGMQDIYSKTYIEKVI